MTSRGNSKNKSMWHILFFTLVMALTASATWAQEEEDTEEDKVRLDRVVVTGSRIKRVDVEGPAPVVVITRDAMDEQGFNSVQDVMDSLVQNTGGSVDQSFVFGFVPGASSIDLRGFGNGRSLTLLDGRRIPIYPVGNSGTQSFVDLASIPVSIIDRIEILFAGASAIYGSDAISGVINIITRRDVEGIDLSMRYGDTDDGGYQTERVILTAGASNDTSNVFITAEYFKNEQLLAPQRDYAASDVANERGAYSSLGATFTTLFGNTPYSKCGDPNDPLGSQTIDVGTSTCRYNRAQWRQLFPENERLSLFSKVHHEFSDTLTGFARAGFADYTTDTQIEPNGYGGWWWGSQPADNSQVVDDPVAGEFISGYHASELGAAPTDYILWGLVLADDPTNPAGDDGWFVRRLFEFGPRTSHIENNGINGLIGLTGIFGSNDLQEWEATVSFNRTRLGITRPNIISSVFNNMVSSGLDLFQIIPPEAVERASFTAVRKAESKNWLADFTVTGEFGWELSGGPVAYAGIVVYEEMKYSDIPDPISLKGDAFDGGSAGGGDRKHYGAGLEVLFPILPTVEVTLAARYDEYDDASSTGGAVSPLINAAWRPTDSLMFRGSWGQSFRAPDMQRLFGATTRAFTTINNPFTGLQEQSIPLRIGSNIDLQEEEGEHINLGIVWEAFNNFTFKADAYNIKLEQLVVAFGAQFTIDTCFEEGLLCQNIDFNDVNGTVIELRSVATNVSLQEITGIDFTFDYDLITERAGLWDFNLQWAWVDSIETQTLPTSEKVENIGFASIPENRVNILVNWNYNNFGATWLTMWVDEMCGVLGSATACESKENWIDKYTISNASIRYDFDRWGRLQLGMNNVFNEDPADDPTNNNWPWFYNNGGYSNPLGREYYLQYDIHWD